MVVNISSTVSAPQAWLVINYPVDYNHTLHWDRLCDDCYNSLVIATSALLLHTVLENDGEDWPTKKWRWSLKVRKVRNSCNANNKGCSSTLLQGQFLYTIAY